MLKATLCFVIKKWKQVGTINYYYKELGLKYCGILPLPLKATLATSILVQKHSQKKLNFLIKTNFARN